MDNSLIHVLFGSNWFFSFVVGAMVLFFITYITREIACWYFKINDIKKLLETIEENTRLKRSNHEPLEKSD